MKNIKTTLLLLFVLVTSLATRAGVFFEDASNYPYADGPIEGQGQWYSYSPLTSPKNDVFVTNNVLLLVTSSTNDAVATPTNGWNNSTPLTYASFRINVSQLPASTNGGYFCQLQNNNDTNDCAHVFIDTLGTTIPGTYRLGIGTVATSFSNLSPPVNYPVDLATNTWYTVVVEFGNINAPDLYQGANLFVNPSENDYVNFLNGENIDDSFGFGYVFATDTTSSTAIQNINITQIGFSPFIYAGISNVMAGTDFDDVNTTNLPVFGIQPQSNTGTNLYSGNPLTLYAVASGVDLEYQWYSGIGGKLSDGAAYTGSTSNTLTINSLSTSDTYYCIVTDTYGNTATSSNAVETVNTTLTPVYFPVGTAPITNSANLFTVAGFTNLAFGTGPLYYQWYFAPTNSPNTFSPLSGQTSPSINFFLSDLTFQGNYYVVVSNAVGGGSIAVGPTNALVELAPVIATMLQLHNLEVSFTNQIAANSGGTVNINTNNVTISGYVSVFGNLPQSSGQNSEYFVQDASGLGIEVFFPGNGNTNVPPIGVNITVSGPIKVFDSQMEVVANSAAAITTNVAATPITFTPPNDNAIFADLSYNGLGVNGLLYQGSLVTFTNCYVYGSRTGGALPNGGLFASNSFVNLYITINGPYSASNTNTLNIFQPAYNLGTATTIFKYNPFDLKPIPSYCYQITGIYDEFKGAGEVVPTRLEDYVTNPPPPFTATIAQAKAVSTLTWQPQVGSTYSVNGATNLLGPWIHEASGLAYYPTNGTFSETNHVPYKFYQITSP